MGISFSRRTIALIATVVIVAVGLLVFFGAVAQSCRGRAGRYCGSLRSRQPNWSRILRQFVLLTR